MRHYANGHQAATSDAMSPVEGRDPKSHQLAANWVQSCVGKFVRVVATALPRPRRRDLALVIAGCLLTGLPHDACAASLSAKDLQVLGRALAFMQPAPTGPLTLAIAYVPNDDASRKDAEAIAALVGDGLRAGSALFRPRLVDTAALGAGGYAVVLAAAGADGERVMAASRAAHVLCVTADFAAVQAGRCVMAIRAEPRVDVLVNHTAAAAAGVEFVAAFRLMIREI